MKKVDTGCIIIAAVVIFGLLNFTWSILANQPSFDIFATLLANVQGLSSSFFGNICLPSSILLVATKFFDMAFTIYKDACEINGSGNMPDTALRFKLLSDTLKYCSEIILAICAVVVIACIALG